MKNIVTRWTEVKASVVESLKTIRVAHDEAMKGIKAECGQQVEDFKIGLGQLSLGESYVLRFYAAHSGSVAVTRDLHPTPKVGSSTGAYEDWGIPIELAEWLAKALPAITPRMIREACEKTL
jgi:hypothetical protein